MSTKHIYIFEKLKEKLSGVGFIKNPLALLGALACAFIILGSLALEWVLGSNADTNKPQLAQIYNTSFEPNSFEREIHQDISQRLQADLGDKNQKLDILEQQRSFYESKINDLETMTQDLAHKVEQMQYDVVRNPYEQQPQITQKKQNSSYSVTNFKDEALSKNTTNYIPSGTFLKAKILGGVDVSTNPSAQKNPQPMLLHVTDWANLPSLGSKNIKHCRITAHAWGDLSSERAYARTDKLSCVLETGDIIDTPVKAFLVDETGKNGIRGDVVARHEGAMITQAFLSKFIGSIGGVSQDLAQGFSKSQEDISWSETLKSGGLKSLGASTKGVGDTLERYFVERLNELSPVIQVFADKDVHVVLTEGVTLIDDKPQQGASYEIL